MDDKPHPNWNPPEALVKRLGIPADKIRANLLLTRAVLFVQRNEEQLRQALAPVALETVDAELVRLRFHAYREMTKMVQHAKGTDGLNVCLVALDESNQGLMRDLPGGDDDDERPGGYC